MTPRRRRPRGGALRLMIGLGILAAALAVQAAEPALYAQLRAFVFDTYQRQAPRPYVPPEPDMEDLSQPWGVRIVDIDEASIARFGQFPWPRPLMAALLDRLDYFGARVVALDIVFSEPDRTSPDAVLPVWSMLSDTAALDAPVSDLPDHDAVLGQQIDGRPVVVGLIGQGAVPDDARLPAVKWGFAFSGPDADSDPRRFVPAFPAALLNLPEIEAAAAGNGALNLIPSVDGVVRALPMFITVGDPPDHRIVPSLVAEAVRVSEGVSTYRMRLAGGAGERAFGAQTGIARIAIGAHEIPLSGDGQMRLYDSGRIDARWVSAADVLDGSVDPWTIANHIVFIGSSAAGLRDLRATPLDSAAAGVEVHAMLTEQILSGRFLVRPDWVGGAEAAFVAVAGAALLIILSRLGALAGAVVSVAMAGGAVAVSIAMFAGQGLLIDPIMPVVALAILWATVSLMGYRQSERERSQIRHAFTHFLAPSLVEQLADNPAALQLGGTTREISLLFADIRGFTSLSETLDPETLTQLINRFLSPMSDVILAERGTIDKFIGDCIMAFWNAPLDDADHARNALTAALKMRGALAGLNDALAAEAATAARRPIRLGIGIGLHAGPACVGNMGTARRFDYSAIGDTVNLAARLEGLSKLYGVDLVASEQIVDRAGGRATGAWLAVELDLIRAKGRREPVRAFTLLETAGAPTPAQTALADAVAAMLAAWRAGDWPATAHAIEDAAAAAERARETRLTGLLDLYGSRLLERAGQPVPEGWDGISDALSK